ncbi:2Fe-2S iron-sulfur cluster binding domain-containing protein [Gordonia jinghuaiqii]|uniref:Oxidoreductase n=1 Tax=Gordonia jinghuaiqii TaxID=2758710 RepID=A0A7D7R5I7_9ACTN|nr:PDR/VanB family oxidoreductase [Gordonia jinghuaiqii]MCR5976334.1 2Fe-2S iron-sulfur cluster binding domain-containing protein [Gordonia jinghuaiqii]QMT03552.1 oxidoreductase [Gordonia jinghuaiqii]
MFTTVALLKLEVTDVREVADRIIQISLSDATGRDLPSWEPGAHVELRLPSGLLRQYSLCGDTADLQTYRIAVLEEQEGRGGSREIHELASVGAVFEVRPPKNNFALVDAESYLFIGGGIGITPMIPMVEEANRRGVAWRLVYGGRTESSMAYRESLAAHGESVDLWIDAQRGHPDLALILAQAPAGTEIYTCGPGPMIDAVAAEFTKHDHLGGLHFERFAASGTIDHSGGSFEVELYQTGVTITVPEGGTILGEVQKILPEQPFSCEEGYCGECETRVIDGEPDHRDDYLTEDEQAANDVMMICTSRCKGERLVLDL